MVNCKHKLAEWLNSVYKIKGHSPFTVHDLGEEYNIRSTIAEAHRSGYLECVGKVKLDKANGYKWINQWRITTHHMGMWSYD